MGKLSTSVTYKRRCAACKQREDACHGLALHYNCLTCIACKSFFYRSGKQLRAAGVAESDMANRAVYEEVLDNHSRYSKCLAAGMDPVLVLDPSKRVASKVPARRVKRSSSASGSFTTGRRSTVKTVPTYRDACTQTPSCTIMPATFGHGDIPALLRALTQATRSRRAALALASAISTAAVAATAPAAQLPSAAASGQTAQTPMYTFHSGYTPRGYTPGNGDAASASLKAANASVGGSTPLAVGAEAAPPVVPDSTLCDPLFQQLLMSRSGASPMAGSASVAASAALGSRFQDLCPPSISTNVGHPPHHGAPTPTFASRAPLSTTSVDMSGFDTPSSALLRGLCMMTP